MTRTAVLTTIQIAHLLRVNDRTVRRWIESGRLHASRRDGLGEYVVLEESLLSFLRGLDAQSKVEMLAGMEMGE